MSSEEYGESPAFGAIFFSLPRGPLAHLILIPFFSSFSCPNPLPPSPRRRLDDDPCTGEFMSLTKEEQKARTDFEKHREEQQKAARSAMFIQMPAKVQHLDAIIKVTCSSCSSCSCSCSSLPCKEDFSDAFLLFFPFCRSLRSPRWRKLRST